EDMDDVGALGGFGHMIDLEPFGAGAVVLGVVHRAHDHLHAAVAQAEGLGLTLAAIADDGHGLALQKAEIGVFFVQNRNHVSPRRRNATGAGPVRPGGWESDHYSTSPGSRQAASRSPR